MKIPYQFYYLDDEDYCIYFKDKDNNIYISESFLDCFLLNQFNEDDFVDSNYKINKVKKYSFNLNYEDLSDIVENYNMEFEKPLKDEGYYISFYRELYNNKYKYKFDFVQYKDNLKFVKDNKGIFNKQLFDEVICWHEIILK